MPARKRTTVHLTDPARMRVLAHPTRLRLLGLLRERGPQTAALLGDVVDEAPGTVSYHLGKLASAGLIVEAQDHGTDGREHWWRSAHDGTSVDPGELLGDPEGLASATLLERAFSQAWAREYDAFIDSVPTLDPEWVRAATASDRGLSLTLEQARELRDELHALADRWQSTSDDNEASRVDGVASVLLLVQAYRKRTP